MSQITARPIWLPILFEDDQEAKTILGGAALAAKGAECRFYISIFETFGGRTPTDPGTVFDISNFIAFILKVYTTDYGSGTVLLDTSDAAAIAAGVQITYNYNAQPSEFWLRAQSQIQIYIPASVTANVAAGTRFGVLTGATAEAAAQPDWFGNFQYLSKEVGLGTAATPPVPAEAYVRQDVFAAFANNVVVYGNNQPGRYPVIVNEGSSYGTALRTGPDGEFLPQQVPNP